MVIVRWCTRSNCFVRPSSLGHGYFARPILSSSIVLAAALAGGRWPTLHWPSDTAPWRA